MHSTRTLRPVRHAVSTAAVLFAVSFAGADPVFRAFWADAFQQGFKSTSQINSLVSRAVTGRYNAVVVEVLAFHDNVGGGHGAYWNSSIVPKATDISGGIDPLAQLVSTAHANGLEVHAWVVPYRVSANWPPAGNATLTAHPEWLMVPRESIDAGPTKINDDYYTLDPGSPEAQQYLTSIVVELCTNYAIDGINFDYIRYVVTNAGYPSDLSYDNSGLARYQSLNGISTVPLADGDDDWDNFRRQTIDELVRRSRCEIAAVASNPRQPLRFTGDLICFGNAPTSFPNSDAYNLFQNWQKWMQLGWLDAGVPMNYKREWNGSEPTWYRNWVNAAINWRYNRHMFCGQGSYLNPKAMSVTQLSYCLNADADGVATYSYVGTADENMNNVWETDWTWYTYVASNLFTTTAPTPTMPWRNAATATEGTLWGRVVDDATSAPIDGGSVQVSGIGSVYTDGNGYYVHTLVPAAPGGSLYTVTAQVTGCPNAIVNNVTVFPGGLARRDIRVCPVDFLAGDMNEDGVVNSSDMTLFFLCIKGPDLTTYLPGHVCRNGDADDDADVDLDDLANFQIVFGS